MDLDRYKWYKSQTSDDVIAFSLFPKGVDTRRCASKDARAKGGGFGGGPTSIGRRKECQRRRWTAKVVDCDVIHGLERRTNHHL